MTASVLTRAMLLAETHALRGYDVVQLAAALEVKDFCQAIGISAYMLVSADVALNRSAQAEGLTVDGPNVH